MFVINGFYCTTLYLALFSAGMCISDVLCPPCEEAAEAAEVERLEGGRLASFRLLVEDARPDLQR